VNEGYRIADGVAFGCNGIVWLGNWVLVGDANNEGVGAMILLK